MQEIAISFEAVEIALVVIWLAVRVALCCARGTADLKSEFLSMAMLVNVAVIVRFALFPLELDGGAVQPLLFDASKMYPPRVNLTLISGLFWYGSYAEVLANFWGNIALFIPTGFLTPIVYPHDKTVFKVVGVGFLMSLSIELIQLVFYTRVTDVNDLALNFIGTVIGYLIYLVVRFIVWVVRKLIQRLSNASVAATESSC